MVVYHGLLSKRKRNTKIFDLKGKPFRFGSLSTNVKLIYSKNKPRIWGCLIRLMRLRSLRRNMEVPCLCQYIFHITCRASQSVHGDTHNSSIESRSRGNVWTNILSTLHHLWNAPLPKMTQSVIMDMWKNCSAFEVWKRVHSCSEN